MTRKKGPSVGQTLGGIIVGFDQQIFRTLPPAQELVAKARPVRRTTGQPPDFEVVFPDDVVDADRTSADMDVGPDVLADLGPDESKT